MGQWPVAGRDRDRVHRDGRRPSGAEAALGRLVGRAREEGLPARPIDVPGTLEAYGAGAPGGGGVYAARSADRVVVVIGSEATLREALEPAGTNPKLGPAEDLLGGVAASVLLDMPSLAEVSIAGGNQDLRRPRGPRGVRQAGTRGAGVRRRGSPRRRGRPPLSGLLDDAADTTMLRLSTGTSDCASKRVPSASASSVEIRPPSSPPKRRIGSVNVAGSWWALTSSRNESSMIGSPRRGAVPISSPLRNRPSTGCPELPVRAGHLVAVGAEPPGVGQARALGLLAGQERASGGRPGAPAQRDQAPREGEQLLLPGVEVPVEPGDLVVLAPAVVVAALGAAHLVAAQQHRRALREESVVRKLRICRARSAWISGSSVGPSAPQFQERLSSVPSRLSSPLASLCFSLYETRSRA